MKVATPTLATLAFVACIGLYGCGNSSDVTNAAGTLDSTPPPAPESISLNTVDRHHELTWAASAAADVAKYQVFRYMPDPTRENSYVMIGESTTPTLDLGRPAEETEAYFRVRAVDQSGNRSAMSTEASVLLTFLGTNGGGGAGGGFPDDEKGGGTRIPE